MPRITVGAKNTENTDKGSEAAERQLNNPGLPHKASVGVGSGCEGTQRQGHLSGLGKDIHPLSMSGRNQEGHSKGQLVQRSEFRETGRWEGMEHAGGAGRGRGRQGQRLEGPRAGLSAGFTLQVG